MDTPKNDKPTEKKPVKRVILLEDLDGEEDIIGGAAQKLFFGESISPQGNTPFGPGTGGGKG